MMVCLVMVCLIRVCLEMVCLYDDGALSCVSAPGLPLECRGDRSQAGLCMACVRGGRPPGPVPSRYRTVRVYLVREGSYS